MRFRTLALTLALAGCLTAAAEAKQKTYKPPKIHKVSVKKNHGYKTNKAAKIKPRKAKTAKSHTKVHKG